MLKINERLDKITAVRADFTAHGMLIESCLIQAIKDAFDETACGDEDSIHEDANDFSETDGEYSDDEIQIFSSGPTGMWNFYDIYDTQMCGLINPDNTEKQLVADDANGELAMNLDDSHPYIPQQPSPAPPNNEEDDDHGPIESGPLMNEVCLIGRKGQSIHYSR